MRPPMQPGDSVTVQLAHTWRVRVRVCVRTFVRRLIGPPFLPSQFLLFDFPLLCSVVQCCAYCGCCFFCLQFFYPNLPAKCWMLYAIVFQFPHCCCHLNDSKTMRYVHNSYLGVCSFTILAGRRVGGFGIQLISLSASSLISQLQVQRAPIGFLTHKYTCIYRNGYFVVHRINLTSSWRSWEQLFYILLRTCLFVCVDGS